MPFRAFIAVDVGALPELVRLSEELSGAETAVKVVEPEKFHLTLKFLGDVDEDAVPRIVEAMETACQGVGPFPMTFRGVGAFPSPDFIKVVWAGVDGGDPLGPIAASLNDDLAHVRAEKREFSPHLTLARMRGAQGKAWVQDFLDRHAEVELDTLEVDAVRLKRSELGPEGPSYATVEEVPLPG